MPMTYEQAIDELRSRPLDTALPSNEVDKIAALHVTDAKAREKVRQWVAALRGGAYGQTPSALYSSDTHGFCCLGVYCEAVDRIPAFKLIGSGFPSALASGEISSFRSTIGDVEDVFANMNDHAQMTFDEIADVVEAILLRPVTYSVTLEVQADSADEARETVSSFDLNPDAIKSIEIAPAA